jgi:hypothetical protein
MLLASSLPWLDWWRRAAALSWAHLDGLAAFGDPRRLRNAVLDDWRQRATDYMRSPEFLALMRFHLTLLNQPMMIKAAQMMSPSVR